MSTPFVYYNIDSVEDDLNERVPSQTGKDDKYLFTNGENTSWVSMITEKQKSFVTNFPSAISASSESPYEYTFPTGYTYTKETNQLFVFLGGVSLDTTLYSEEDEEEGTVCSKIYIKKSIAAGDNLYVIIGPTNLQGYYQDEVESITGKKTSLETDNKENCVSAINELNYKYDNVFLRVNPQKVEMSWSDVQGYTRAGTASQNFSVGDYFEESYNGTAFKFYIIGFDYDVPVDTSLTHSTTIQLFTMNIDQQYDRPEADYFFEDGASAGTYNFTASGTSYQFTISQDIPEGAQFRFLNSRSNWLSNKVCLFESPSSIAELERCDITQGSDGTSLGTLSETSPWNIGDRRNYGCHLYSQSDIKQRLNADLLNNWWSPISPWDRNPDTSAVAGFKYYLNSGLKDVVGEVWKRTAIMSWEGGGYIDTKEKFFLLSKGEVDGTTNNNVWETPVTGITSEGTRDLRGITTSIGLGGTPKELAYPYWSQIEEQSDRILRNTSGTAKNWWLRSPDSGHARYAWFVMTSGAFDWCNVYHSGSASPALAIV